MESILAQTYGDLELLVVDDASTDDSPGVAGSLDDERVRVVRNDKNLGNARNRSHAIRLSKCALIKFVDQDDWLEAVCLEEHVRCMDANPNVGLTFCRATIALEDPISPKAEWWSRWSEEVRRSTSELDELNRGVDLVDRFVKGGFHGNWIGGPTSVMLRKSCLYKSGLFNRRLRQMLDVDLWVRVMAISDVGYLDHELAGTWVGSANETNSVRATRRDWLDRLWMLEGLMESPELWARYPELAAMRRAELKSVAVSTVTGRFRTTRLLDALRDTGGYAADKLRKTRNHTSLFDWL